MTNTSIDSSTLVTVKIEGQEIKLAAAIANNDDLLRRVLAPVYPGAANSTITRSADGKTVDVIKKAGTKGEVPAPISSSRCWMLHQKLPAILS